MSWDTLTSQIHHHSSHLTLSERKNENFQSTQKIIINAHLLLRKSFLLVLGTLRQ